MTKAPLIPTEYGDAEVKIQPMQRVSRYRQHGLIDLVPWVTPGSPNVAPRGSTLTINKQNLILTNSSLIPAWAFAAGVRAVSRKCEYESRLDGLPPLLPSQPVPAERNATFPLGFHGIRMGPSGCFIIGGIMIEPSGSVASSDSSPRLPLAASAPPVRDSLWSMIGSVSARNAHSL
ncbi:hypothetical protein N7456_008309 [Penicillium angulare]|uniref:Uncharacterized protein n=1 Tax=Penicillium angulare TaxID=116970 RepID=A0A9W9K947_9EURO|nr:hypothetical protein N7456_008309 [Penicillium angulare]